MKVTIPDDIQDFVTDSVKRGAYDSASEFVGEKLRNVAEREQLYHAKLQDLRREIQKGIDSGEPQPFDINRIMAKVKAKLKAAGKRA